MDTELINKINNLEQKIDENTRQLRKLSRYFLWTLIISAAVIILPFIGLIFMIPQYLNTIQSFGI